MTIQLHYAPATASMIPHLLLEEMGTPFELVLVDNTADAHRTPAYLALNPNGLLPALTDSNGLVLYETAAICLHLCDTHPQAGMAPAIGTSQRAHFYKWLVWLTNTLQSALIVYFYPHRWTNEGNDAGVAEVKAHAQAKIDSMLDQLDTELARHDGPWFMGETYTALDPYVFTLCRWTRNFNGRKARDLPRLGRYLQRVLERPASQRVMVTEKLSAPFY